MTHEITHLRPCRMARVSSFCFCFCIFLPTPGHTHGFFFWKVTAQLVFSHSAPLCSLTKPTHRPCSRRPSPAACAGRTQSEPESGEVTGSRAWGSEALRELQFKAEKCFEVRSFNCVSTGSKKRWELTVRAGIRQKSWPRPPCAPDAGLPSTGHGRGSS